MNYFSSDSADANQQMAARAVADAAGEATVAWMDRKRQATHQDQLTPLTAQNRELAAQVDAIYKAMNEAADSGAISEEAFEFIDKRWREIFPEALAALAKK